MTPEQFTYWLQGFAEINQQKGGLTDEQWTVICDHLKTVFHKVTPDYQTPNTILAQYPSDDPFGAHKVIC